MQSSSPVARSFLFADVKGYSKLDTYQYRRFLEIVIPGMASVFDRYRPEYLNTWGDAVFAVYDLSRDAANGALDLCRLFKDTLWAEEGLPSDLSIRLALHFGECHRGVNPITKREEYLGNNVNLAARIEPGVRPNEVWATERFLTNLEPGFVKKLYTLALGERELVKGWGPLSLFRIARDELSPETALAGSYPTDPQFPVIGIHHINLPVRVLSESVRFYREVLRLRQADDPEVMEPSKRRLKFDFPGVWFELPSGQQLHLIPQMPDDPIEPIDPEKPPVTFRQSRIINFKDVHFAFSVRNYQATYEMLLADENNRIVAGPKDCQFYILDPDNHIIEITSMDGPREHQR